MSQQIEYYAMWLLSFALLLAICLRLFGTRRKGTLNKVRSSKIVLDWEMLRSYVRETLQETVYADLRTFGVSEEEYERMRNRRTAIKQALQSCTSGDGSAKLYIRQFIYDRLAEAFLWNEQSFDSLLSFAHVERMTAQDQFDILLYIYKKKFAQQALAEMLVRIDPRERKVRVEDVQTLYKKERPQLVVADKLMIVAQRVYQQVLGFGVIDELRDMAIDGVSGGVSGMPSMFAQSLANGDTWQGAYDYDSIWIFFRGQSIHMECLSFGSAEELKRVCQNIYKFNYPGQLSERNGYKVNQMADGSRVVVVRPPFSESWAFFVRKFDLKSTTLQQLIEGDGASFIRQLLVYLVSGARVTAVTGAQGSGKTTLLMALVQHIDEAYNIRVQEMAFELRLRSIYPQRNILSFRETDHVSGQVGLDVQKKTDGTVNIIGEVASDEVATWMIQAAQVASLFTIFTHHAKTFADLVFSLRNSLLKTGVFSQEKMAEQQVVSVLHFNVHLRRETDGRRSIERITECVVDAESGESSFSYRDIAIYREGQYHAGAPISVRNKRAMLEQMSASERPKFLAFCAQHWKQENAEVYVPNE